MSVVKPSLKTLCRLGLHVRQHVAVGIECQNNRRMAESLTDDLRIQTILKQQRSATVAQIVKAEARRQSRLL